MKIKTPRLGETKQVLIPTKEIYRGPKLSKGIYLGRHPIKKDWFVKLDSPEGHTFLVEDNGKKEVYCQRTRELDFELWSDGDSTCYPMGIRVEKVEGVKLNNYELEFIKKRSLQIGITQ